MKKSPQNQERKTISFHLLAPLIEYLVSHFTTSRNLWPPLNYYLIQISKLQYKIREQKKILFFLFSYRTIDPVYLIFFHKNIGIYLTQMCIPITITKYRSEVYRFGRVELDLILICKVTISIFVKEFPRIVLTFVKL